MDREQLARECALIEKSGGDVLAYLAGHGCVSPWGTWHRLQRENLGRKSWQIKDGRRTNDMGKVSAEQRKMAVEIALKGESPYSFLKECGSSAPEQIWYTIKQKLKEEDPETYRKLPERLKYTRREPEAGEKPDAEILEAAPAAVTKPVNYDGLDVTAVRNPKTCWRYEFDQRHGIMAWRTISGDEVSMTPTEWHELVDELPKVMQIFGI